MGMYSGLSATKLDSHANMAVAGNETTIIAHSGAFSNVTPFSKDLPAMDMVEIGDAAMCFDDPISLETYILVMKNALLIPTMGHSLIPPFLIREAGLILDETPKHQTPCPSIDNHSIWDQWSGLWIHLQLNGIFSYFNARPLTLEEQENWMDYQVIFITPGGDSWDPYSEHYAKEEAAMVDVNGLLVERDPRPQSAIFSEADINKLYGEPVTWDHYKEVGNAIYDDDGNPVEHPISSDDLARLHDDGIRAQVAGLDGILFSGELSERALMLHVSMAIHVQSLRLCLCLLLQLSQHWLRSLLGKEVGSWLNSFRKCSASPMMILLGHCQSPPSLYDSILILLSRGTLVPMIMHSGIGGSSQSSSLTLYLQLMARRVLVAINALRYLSPTKALYRYTL